MLQEVRIEMSDEKDQLAASHASLQRDILETTYRPHVGRAQQNPNLMAEDFDYDNAHCYGVYRCCAIQMWRGEVLPHHVPLMERRWLRLIAQQGSFATLVVALPSAPPPSAARRDEIRKVYAGLAKQIKAVGTVIEDQGIKGTAGSMVMTTIMLMSKTPYPYKNGTSVEQIAGWLSQQVVGVQPRKLIEAVEDMRRQFTSISANEFGEPLVARLRTVSR